MKACSFEGCKTSMKYLSRGYCRKHYMRLYRHGAPERIMNTPRETPIKGRIEAVGWDVTDAGCWEYRVLNSNGYGTVYFEHHHHLVHRVMYELACGPIPEGLDLRHGCDNPPCCNPGHLEVGTHAQNMRDAVERERMANGENHGMATLTDQEVGEMRVKYAAGGRTQKSLGEEYGCSASHVSAIIRGVWRRVPTYQALTS